MAGDNVYIGEMIAGLQTKIDEMVTAMAAQTTALGNINAAVAQSVSALNIKPGTTVKNLGNAILSTTSTTTVSLKGITAFCVGKFYINFTIYTSSIGEARAAYRLNGGAWVDLPPIGYGVTHTPITQAEIPILTAGTLVEIGLRTNSASYPAYIEAGITFKYDLIDIVNDGPFGI
jgi:hypothetical protein